MSKMLSGTPILVGDNDIPGIKLHKELRAVLPRIEQECRDMGLDYYPIIVEIVPYDVMSELASYDGFPTRYPHWKWGMEYERMARGYEYGQYRISEMVINTNPCNIFCMDSNTLGNNVNVVAHAIGHNDFFKNNVFFAQTDENMLNRLATHATRIRKYSARWGEERVTEFLDHVLRLETLIDSNKAWSKKTYRTPDTEDKRMYRFPKRLETTHDYLDPFVNTPDYLAAEQERIDEEETREYLDIFDGPEKDILGYLKDNAPLKPWQQDIICMIYEEAMYFAPQRQTKMINEGWASYVDFEIMCRRGLISLGQEKYDDGIWDYAEHKMYVLGGKYSQNPYKIGFELLLDIEDRWNKGKFGDEWENCKDMNLIKDWDKKLGRGMEKVFDVRRCYNDFTLIQEFFTKEFCDKHEFYEWKKFPDGTYQIVSRDFKAIKKKMMKKYLNGGLPDIRLVDPNHLGKGYFLMKNMSDDQELDDFSLRETMSSIYRIWNNDVMVETKNRHGSTIVYHCYGPDADKNVIELSKDSYVKKFMTE